MSVVAAFVYLLALAVVVSFLLYLPPKLNDLHTIGALAIVSKKPIG